MGVKLNIRLPRLPSPIQRMADRAGVSQSLGADWAWLADFRDAIKSSNAQRIRKVLVESPLTQDQIGQIITGAEDAYHDHSVQTEKNFYGDLK